MEHLKMQTADGVQDNIQKIAQLFPDCVTETMDVQGRLVRKVDAEKLMQNLSGQIISEREERYQFMWPDKKKAILLANAPITATLLPCREESVDFDNTKNLYIEGDNLDVLKCLKETYLHKVKMIYIDPPYNTGNDFVYEDDFTESSVEYLATSGQFDEQGNRLFSNTESNGRFHTDWLNMIYPRLKVARDLLTEDGAIFISMDDNEDANLRKVCDEIFGESNFKANISWQKRYTRSNNTIDFTTVVEHILVYAKSDKFVVNLLPRTQEADDRYSNPDNDPRGKWKGASFLNPATPTQRPNLCYPITNPNTGETTVPTTNAWRRSKEVFDSLQAEKKLYWGIDGKSKVPSVKMFLSEARGLTPINYWDHEYAGNTDDGTSELQGLMGHKVFNFPKPSLLIKRVLQHVPDKEGIYLDFFSGSATTAHAIMQLNAEDGGTRKFIMVQLPEICDEQSEAFKAGYKNICEIGKERIRRAGKKIKDESPLTTQTIDTGFRVLKLKSSNMKDTFYAPSDIQQADLFSQVDNVKNGRTSEDLLFQVMLEHGVTLDSKIESAEVDGKTIYNVADGYLVACFDKDVTDSVVTSIAKMQPTYSVLRDTSMASDSTATNFVRYLRHTHPTL